MVDPLRRVRFNPEINLGHVLSSFAFIGTGVALYVSIVTSVNDLNTKQAALDKLNLPNVIQQQAITAERLLAQEEANSRQEEANKRQVETNEKIIEQLATLNTAVAVVGDRLRRPGEPALPLAPP